MACIACSGAGLVPLLDLGRMPLTAAYVAPEDAAREERRYPLRLVFCEGCSLVQLDTCVPRREVFTKTYAYRSSTSSTMVDHARMLAERLVAARALSESSLVVEVASNDGYLLRFFAERGIPVMGIDPAEGAARDALASGIDTRIEHFDRGFGRRLRREGVIADLVLALNVFAHVEDPVGLASGVADILRDDGVAVIEVPYVRDLVDRLEFDTIYHEHLCYYSATTAAGVLRRGGLELLEVERLSIHGGSLRLFAARSGQPGESVARLLQDEAAAHLDRVDYYSDFAARVGEVRTAIRNEVARLRREGATLAAYGAAAKGVVLLEACGISAADIELIVDRNEAKHGLLMPGLRIPIHPPSRLRERMPDVTLLLPWNLRSEILEQEAEYRRRGGRFLIPLPEPEIV